MMAVAVMRISTHTSTSIFMHVNRCVHFWFRSITGPVCLALIGCTIWLSQSGVAWASEASLDSIRTRAEKGDSYAQAILAMKYRRGEGVAKDYTAAFKWAKLSADQTHPPGLFEMAMLYEYGLGVDTDEQKAQNLYEKSFPGLVSRAEKGDADAQNKVGIMYRNGFGVAKDDATAVKWFRTAAERGDAYGQINLGWTYASGQGVLKDYAAAVKWYEKAAKQGNAVAQYFLGSMYWNGLGVPKYESTARRWFQKSADQGHTDAIEMLRRIGEVDALKNTFTVTSDPPGANVDFNGQTVGVTPLVSRQYLDYCFNGPSWAFSDYLAEPISLHIWQDGYLPKDVNITRGPYVGDYGQWGKKVYYLISGTSFHVKLQTDPAQYREEKKIVDEHSNANLPPVKVETPIQQPRIEVDVETQIQPGKLLRPNTIAVVIGNQTYGEKLWNADYAVRDANWMKQYFVQRMGISAENVIQMNNVTLSQFQSLFGNQSGDIKSSRLYRRLREPGWDVIVYYSGHGATSADDRGGYLLPVDADPDYLSSTAYRLDALYQNLHQLTDGHITVILEACFSGRTPKGQIGGKSSGVVIVDPRTGADTGIDILAAAHSDQVANWYEDQQHGLFTYFLMRALRGDADTNGDGEVVGTEIKDYVTREVSRLSDRVGVAVQEPEITVAPDWVWTE